MASQAYGVYIWHKKQNCIWATRMVHSNTEAQAIYRAQEIVHKALLEAGVPVNQWGDYHVEFNGRVQAVNYVPDSAVQS